MTKISVNIARATEDKCIVVYAPVHTADFYLTELLVWPSDVLQHPACSVLTAALHQHCPDVLSVSYTALSSSPILTPPH